MSHISAGPSSPGDSRLRLHGASAGHTHPSCRRSRTVGPRCGQATRALTSRCELARYVATGASCDGNPPSACRPL